jgi:Mg2+ and Co2+ transporter CorA
LIHINATARALRAIVSAILAPETSATAASQGPHDALQRLFGRRCPGRRQSWGVEALPGIDQRGAAELNDYADQVEDLERCLQERSRWASDIVQDCATAIAQCQGEQINRLTLVSLIFLPIIFSSGFFGMNSNWIIDTLGSPTVFVLLGRLLPASSVLLTVLWFKRHGLM